MSWAEAVTAISTAVIAVMVVLLGISWLLWLKEMQELQRTVERLVDVLDREARPALQSARQIMQDAEQVVGSFRSEAHGVVDTAHDARQRLERLVVKVEERLSDLDALIDVFQYEIEETALDVAAALRTTRRGASVVRAMKRAFLRRGR
ncbi:MAG: hypothetical protein PVF27_08970 [Gemmatimonadales bacterium]|jgi:hypothetical protein